MLFTVEPHQLQERAEGPPAPQHPPAERARPALLLLPFSQGLSVGVDFWGATGWGGCAWNVGVTPTRCQHQGCPTRHGSGERHCHRACPSQPRLVLGCPQPCSHGGSAGDASVLVLAPSLPSPAGFSIVAPVLCVEEGSVSCSFAILVALGLNLIFFFSTSVFLAVPSLPFSCFKCLFLILHMFDKDSTYTIPL